MFVFRLFIPPGVDATMMMTQQRRCKLTSFHYNIQNTDVLFQSAQKVASKRNEVGGTDGIYKDDVDNDTLTTRNSFTIV